MIQVLDLLNRMKEQGIDFYTGVPDSLLASFCACIDDNHKHSQHLIAANEGNAIALAIGYHMASQRIPVVYMQNSGLGNTVNPLVSLADPKVYKVPILLIIGWRGEPDIDDEPQHKKQGEITLSQLEILNIPYWILSGNCDYSSVLNEAFSSLRNRNAPVALVVRKDTFLKYNINREVPNSSATLLRENAIEQLLDLFTEKDLVISTTGKTSRELFELREKRGHPQRDFMTVGGMGHASSIALGVCIGQPNRRVICLDGDGAMIMHMGALPVIGKFQPKNFIHILLNNESHESVGGQVTASTHINYKKLADSVGYKIFAQANSISDLTRAWSKVISVNGPALLEIKIKVGSRDDLGRPTTSAEDNKNAFMKFAND